MTRIISTHSYRGGTGKSNVTANLAALQAAAGKRVAIVDTDLPSPGIHMLFGLDEQTISHTLNDYLWSRCSIEDTAHDVTAVLGAAPATGRLFLVPASMRGQDLTRIVREGYDANMLNDGLFTLLERLELDYLFIDTHPGCSEDTLLAVAVSDLLIVMLRPDRQDFQGTAVVVEVARKLEVPNMRIVINKVPPGLDTDALKSRVTAAYSVPVSGILPLATDMVELGSAGIFSVMHPGHALTAEFHRIGADVVAASG
jgi:MinD-like ATPase involved in chromosome partitioning or flagellar assembly